ncbi:hypothetical protein, partial [Lewinella cohaerens]|uniref:hypothetical protein n=1 Tax=Lewinella cohaerens TaxID=70995 RepID=UPI0005C50DED
FEDLAGQLSKNMTLSDQPLFKEMDDFVKENRVSVLTIRWVKSDEEIYIEERVYDEKSKIQYVLGRNEKIIHGRVEPDSVKEITKKTYEYNLAGDIKLLTDTIVIFSKSVSYQFSRLENWYEDGQKTRSLNQSHGIFVSLNMCNITEVDYLYENGLLVKEIINENRCNSSLEPRVRSEEQIQAMTTKKEYEYDGLQLVREVGYERGSRNKKDYIIDYEYNELSQLIQLHYDKLRADINYNEDNQVSLIIKYDKKGEETARKEIIYKENGEIDRVNDGERTFMFFYEYYEK